MDTLASFRIDPESLDFDLPDDLIAQQALKERDQARLLVVSRESGEIEDKIFADLPDYLKAGDVLVVNKAKVSRAKFFAAKKTGGKVEIILIEPFKGPLVWKALLRPFMKIGTEFVLANGTLATLTDRNELGENILTFDKAPDEFMERDGQVPLPPYIKRSPDDKRAEQDDSDYQTVYSSVEGSLAAPTAGLHFTSALLDKLKAKGVEVIEILLHVGWGTFRPIRDKVSEHEMLGERYEVSAEAFEKLKKAKQDKRRIVTVGTTSTRVLESLDQDSKPEDLNGVTNIFITPGHSFRWQGGFVTNLHVPKSTPIALTAAFVGLDKLEKAYRHAIEKKYRFFSYGDAMLII